MLYAELTDAGYKCTQVPMAPAKPRQELGCATFAGAYLADRYLGKYRCILYLSSVYCMGHVILAVWESRLGTYIGLTAIASGAGGIKPCVSSFMGDQFPSERHYLLKGAFSAFYWTINCGSLAATLSIPIIYNKGGSSWAFGVPGEIEKRVSFIPWVFPSLLLSTNGCI